MIALAPLPVATGTEPAPAAGGACPAPAKGFMSVLDGCLGESVAQPSAGNSFLAFLDTYAIESTPTQSCIGGRPTPGKPQRTDRTAPVATPVPIAATPTGLTWGFSALPETAASVTAPAITQPRLQQSSPEPATSPAPEVEMPKQTDELAFGVRLFSANTPDPASNTLPPPPLALNPQPANPQPAPPPVDVRPALSADPSSMETEASKPPAQPSHTVPQGPQAAPVGRSDTEVVASVKPATPASDASHDDRNETAHAPHEEVEILAVPTSPATAASAEHIAPAKVTEAAPPPPPDPPAPPTQPTAHGVSLHLADGPDGVNIRMAERAGEIQVTVHTPSHELAGTLRSDLPDLVGKLRQSGFQAETWHPERAPETAASREGGSSFLKQDSGGGQQGDGRHPHSQPKKDQSRWAGEWNSTLDPDKELFV